MREAPLRDDVRLQAYNTIERMARSVGHRVFRLELEALVALASQDGRIGSTLHPFWDELRALLPQLQG